MATVFAQIEPDVKPVQPVRCNLRLIIPGASDGDRAQIEVGPIEVALRDDGALDLAVAQYARALKVTREAARIAIIEDIESSVKYPLAPVAQFRIEASTGL